MPFTPYHGGFGLLLKGVAPRRASLTTFIATQVVIDCETAYHMVHGEYPLHRFAHTLLGGTLVGLVVALIVAVLGRWSLLSRHASTSPLWPGEVTPAGVAIAGVFGGISHALLDSVVHVDVQPFWPISGSSPLYGCAAWGTVEAMCVAAGIVGTGLILLRLRPL